MSAEHKIKQGATGAYIEDDDLALQESANLTAAVLQFCYRLPDADEWTTRAATIESASPSTGAATSFTGRRTLSAADTEDAGVFVYEWRLTLASGEVLPLVVDASMDDYPQRAYRAFEIIESSGVTGGSEADDDGATVNPIVANLTELAALPWSENYLMATCVNDANGDLSTWEWDADVVTADAVTNAVVPLADSRGGGWRRKGL